jgi:catechol 2,3-dioxygenase-like lactoylglutathione lyase family enzyme
MLFCLFLAAALAQGAASTERPAIVGVAHIALETDDVSAARKFYGTGLGFEEPFQLDKAVFFKVNDHQYIKVSADLKTETQDRLSHIAFETTDIQKLRNYLASRGVTVPATLKPDPDGNMTMMLEDPDGHHVEFVQYMPGSLLSRNFGKFLGSGRVSTRIIHVGVTVKDRAAADRFYKDILGFKMTWYGGKNDTEADWVDMRVPEGTDWLEYMLNVHNPSPKQLGVMHHLALGVDNIQEGYRLVLERGVKPPQPPKIGRDGKWQLNLYDPNFTRAELMEPKPVEKPCCSPILDLPIGNAR